MSLVTLSHPTLPVRAYVVHGTSGEVSRIAARLLRRAGAGWQVSIL